MKSLTPFTWQQSKKNLLIQDLSAVYQDLRSYFGFQHWWPGDTPFEVMVGAILTQNTAWTHVERAISILKKQDCLTPQAMRDVSIKQLAEWIRPAGYFNVKARRLKSFVGFLYEQFSGDLEALFRSDGKTLRKKLLEVNGIGPETADSMLLYAGSKPFFVVDAYTRRIFTRHALSAEPDPVNKARLRLESLGYEAWRFFFESALPHKTRLYNDFHAQIVVLAKTHCKASSWSCHLCPLSKYL